MVVECLSDFGKMDGATRTSVGIVVVKSHMQNWERSRNRMCAAAAAAVALAQEVIPAKATNKRNYI